MNLKGIILTLFLIATINTEAQSAFNTSAVIDYKMKDVSKNGERYKNSKLIIKDATTLFVYNKIGLDSLQEGKRVDMKDGGLKGVSIYSPEIDEKGIQIYKNYFSQEMLIRRAKVLSFPPMLVEDYWPIFHFKIEEEFKEISGYKVQKATTHFRGRDYVLWFAENLNLPYGPWKFHGLPGLILEAYDNKEVVHFLAESICIACHNNLKQPDEELTYPIEEYVFMKDFTAEFMGVKLDKIAKETSDGEAFVVVGTPTTKNKIKKIRKKYKAERLFEWEDYPGDYDEKKIQHLKELISDLPEPPKEFRD
ncbi:MAG: GLPGLI family protein [Bacteroidota bacterium]